MHIVKSKQNISLKCSNFFYLLVIGILGLSKTAYASVDLDTKEYDETHFYYIDSPNQRQLNPNTYFKHEYKYLNARSGLRESDARPKHLLGLAFSGGGIRSAAFQLGMLAGLHSADKERSQLLPRIDYISSVSGGSWANGSYWSTNQPDNTFFSCLNAFAETGLPKADCKPPSDKLRDAQTILKLPLDSNGWKQRKEAWEEEIIKAHLDHCNIDFNFVKPYEYKSDEVAPCLTASVNRPYPIFNSTHSSSEEEASADHYPFQSTPDYQGTITDDKNYRGFFLRSGSENFLWESRNWKRWLPGGEKDRPGEVLSLILAHSSGVVGSKKPFLLQYNFHAHYRNNKSNDSLIKGLRRIYNLADGGKTDNLGLLPLFERGVETIIVSQMGKEGEDFGDIKLAEKQANHLFGCTFISDWKRDVQPVVITPYNCPHASGGLRHGNLVLVRPTIKNVLKFLEELKKQNPDLYTKLEEIDKREKPEDRFPETPTFREKYEPELVRAYFLLGRYLAETSVRDALSDLNIVQ